MEKYLMGNFILKYLDFPHLPLDHQQLVGYQRLFWHNLVKSHVFNWNKLLKHASLNVTAG